MKTLISIEKELFLIKKLKPTCIEVGISYIDCIKKNKPEYYNNVMLIINTLGDITLVKGHSKELDDLKNKAWSLIGL
jgi:hypothetical protein